jgi:hypothetical protein
MDEHRKAIHELCDTYYHDNINASISDEITDHLIKTREAKSATEEIINRLSVESRIEILAELMVLATLMDKKIITFSREVFVSLLVFRNLDKTLGLFVENHYTESQKLKISEAIYREIELDKKFMKGEDPSYEESQEQIKRLTDKSVYSYQTLLELIVGLKLAQRSGQSIELIKFFEMLIAYVRLTINTFKLYRS